MNSTFLELRMFSTLLEKLDERRLEICEWLRMSISMNSLKPRKLLVLDLVELLLQFHTRRFLTSSVLPVPLSQCPVPDKSRRTTSLCKVSHLLACRVELDFVSKNHLKSPRLYTFSRASYCSSEVSTLREFPQGEAGAVKTKGVSNDSWGRSR
jgi:hypothetical protein